MLVADDIIDMVGLLVTEVHRRGLAMFQSYIDAALKQAQCEYDREDERYYCDIPELPGVWSYGDTRHESYELLREVLVDWVQLGLDQGHSIPSIRCSSRCGAVDA